MNSSHRMMKDEEARCIATVEAFRVVDKKSQELTTKLIEVERDKKSAEAALNGGRGRQRLDVSSFARPRISSLLPKAKLKF